MKTQLTPEQRTRLEALRDQYLEGAALFREVTDTLRGELHRRGYTDEQIDKELSKRPRRKPRYPRPARKRSARPAFRVS